MLSVNRIIISAAGGGKTTRVVDQALVSDQGVTALVTYTRNNIREIEQKVYERCPSVPSHIEVVSWYSFLLREMARPYRAVLHPKRIDGIHWVEGKSVPYVPQTNTSGHYFLNGTKVYSDKLAKLICECERLSGGAVLRRLKQRYGHIIIDEIQDMAGYDLDLLEMILKAGIPVTFVGDHRQATIATNNAAKNKAFAGAGIIAKFEEWQKADLVSIEYECHTHRCNQSIADLGDSFFPSEPKTQSLNTTVTGHDGVFIVKAADVDAYAGQFAPKVLRYSASTKCAPYQAMNFGEAKGMTFDRVLIFPHGKAQNWIKSGDLSYVAKTVTKMYVGVTRARYSVAFVYDGAVHAIAAQAWSNG